MMLTLFFVVLESCPDDPPIMIHDDHALHRALHPVDSFLHNLCHSS